MIANEDVFGQALWDYYEGRHDIVKKYGWLSQCERYFSEYSEWFPRERDTINTVHGKVLDIGCAAGRHSLYLQQKGHTVVSIDNSLLAIKICKLRGLKHAQIKSIDDISKNIGIFDSIIMYGNNFGLMGTIENAMTILQTFADITTPHAKLLVGAAGLDDDKLEESMNEQIKKNVKAGVFQGEVIYHLNYGDLHSSVNWLAVTKDEMSELLKDSPWCVSDIKEDKQFPAPHPYVATLKKKKA